MRVAVTSILCPLCILACGSETSDGGGSSSGTPTAASVAQCLDFCGRFGGECGALCDDRCERSVCEAPEHSESIVGIGCVGTTLNYYDADGLSGGCSGAAPSKTLTARPPKGSVADAKRAFLTRVTYNGNLRKLGDAATGLEGADKLCGEVATAAQLRGTWKAWLSDSTTNALDRIADVSPWYNTDRSAILFPNKATLGTKPYATMNFVFLFDEHAKPFAADSVNMWTGTETSGRRAEHTCSDWTSEDLLPEVGQYTTASTSSWNDGTIQDCFRSASLFCLEQ